MSGNILATVECVKIHLSCTSCFQRECFQLLRMWKVATLKFCKTLLWEPSEKKQETLPADLGGCERAELGVGCWCPQGTNRRLRHDAVISSSPGLQHRLRSPTLINPTSPLGFVAGRHRIRCDFWSWHNLTFVFPGTELVRWTSVPCQRGGGRFANNWYRCSGHGIKLSAFLQPSEGGDQGRRQGAGNFALWLWCAGLLLTFCVSLFIFQNHKVHLTSTAFKH